MKFRVEIGEEATEYSFNDKTVFVGASEDCHITLAYEGIGRAHLEISEERGGCFVSDLGSGEKTFLNSEAITPLKKIEFNSFFPIELGGIYIYLIDESIGKEDNLDDSLNRLSENISQSLNVKDLEVVDAIGNNSNNDIPFKTLDHLNEKSTSPDPGIKDGGYDPLVTLENELAASEALDRDEGEVESENGEVKEENKKKYKPEIYIPTGNTNSGTGSNAFKIKLPVDKSYSTTRKTKIRNKAQKKIGSKKKRKSNSAGSYIILMAVFAVTVSIYIFKYRKPEINNANKKVIQKFRIKASQNGRIQEKSAAYTSFVNQPKCNNTFEKEICKQIRTKINNDSFLGALTINKTLYIATTEEVLKSLTTNNLKYDVSDDAWVQNTIKKKYSDYFNYAEFLENNKKATLAEFEFNKDVFNLNNLILFFLFDGGIYKKVTANKKIENIHFVIMNEFKKLVSIEAFLDIKIKMLGILAKDLKEETLKLKGFNNSFLTEGIEEYYMTRASTQVSEFDSVIYDDHIKKLELKKYQKFLNHAVCDKSNVDTFCEEMRKQRSLKSSEGAFIVDSNLYIKFELPEVTKMYEKKYRSYKYSVKDRKLLISNFKKHQKLDDMKAFFKNDFYNKNLSPDQVNINKAVSTLTGSNLIGLAKNNSNIKNLILLGIQTEDKAIPLKTIVSFEMSKLKKTDIGLNTKNHLFFWRSNIPAFNQYIQSKSKLFVGFSK